MRTSSVLTLLLVLALFSNGPGGAQTAQAQSTSSPSEETAFSREAMRASINADRVILMSGALGGPYLHIANDIAQVTNSRDKLLVNRDKLRVHVTLSTGAVANVRDVLLMKGVDLGMTTVQILNALKAKGDFGPNLESQIRYISVLSVDTMHVLAGPGINSLKDLSGKRVAFNVHGSGTARFAPGILRSLGVDIAKDDELNLTQGDAIQAIRNGEIAATLCSCPIPVPTHAGLKAGSGFRLLPIPYVRALERDYVPASLSHDHYPNLVPNGEKVETIATSTILITFNWPPGSDRYRKMEKFVNAFFSNFDKLMQPPRHAAWRNVNLGATIRGWQRFQPAQEWIDRQAAEEAAKRPGDATRASADVPRDLPRTEAERERLFKEFLEWAKKRPRR